MIAIKAEIRKRQHKTIIDLVRGSPKIYELFTREVAEGDCLYADGCPTGARHYKCDPCRAREIIKATLAV